MDLCYSVGKKLCKESMNVAAGYSLLPFLIKALTYVHVYAIIYT